MQSSGLMSIWFCFCIKITTMTNYFITTQSLNHYFARVHLCYNFITEVIESFYLWALISTDDLLERFESGRSVIVVAISRLAWRFIFENKIKLKIIASEWISIHTSGFWVCDDTEVLPDDTQLNDTIKWE